MVPKKGKSCTYSTVIFLQVQQRNCLYLVASSFTNIHQSFISFWLIFCFNQFETKNIFLSNHEINWNWVSNVNKLFGYNHIKNLLKSSLNAKLMKPLILLDSCTLTTRQNMKDGKAQYFNYHKRLSALKENKIWKSPNSEKKISQY